MTDTKTTAPAVTASATTRRVYVVQHGDSVLLVRATSAHNAVMHVYAPLVRVATFEDAKPDTVVEDAK